MKWKPIFAGLVIAVCGSAHHAHAVGSCTITSITPCTFAYDPSNSTATSVQGAINFNCTATTGNTGIQMSFGSSGTSARKFSNLYPYNVYWNVGHTVIVTNTATDHIIVPTVGANSATIYCMMPALQSIPAGSYSETLTAKVSYTSISQMNTNVTATVTASCSVSITANLVFGAYDPIVANSSTNLDGMGSASVNCSTGAAYVVTAGQGTYPAGGSTDAAPLREMNSSGNRLRYSIYSNAGRTTVLGNTAGTGAAGTGSGSAQTVNLYGRIASGLNKPTGSYSDTVIVTVTY